MTHHFLVSVGTEGTQTAVQRILVHVWKQTNLEGMMIPHMQSQAELPEPTLLHSVDELNRSTLLAPYMPFNAASKAVELLASYPGGRLAFALKPCELRSLRQYSREKSVDISTAILISADCLAVFPTEDIEWRLADAAMDTLTDDVLRFAPQGGILLSRFQQSCQVCEKPYPIGADLQFELIGLDASDHMVATVEDPAWLESLDMDIRPASAELLEHRTHILENLVSWRSKALHSACQKLDRAQSTPEGLMEHIKSCRDCREQLESMCLLYEEGMTSTKSATIEWLGTCSGCGTCDYQCPTNYPLFAVIARLSEIYRERVNDRAH